MAAHPISTSTGVPVAAPINPAPTTIIVGGHIPLPVTTQEVLDSTGVMWHSGGPRYTPLPIFCDYTDLGHFPVPPSPRGPTTNAIHAPQNSPGSYLMKCTVPIYVMYSMGNNSSAAWHRSAYEPHCVSCHTPHTLIGSGNFQKFLHHLLMLIFFLFCSTETLLFKQHTGLRGRIAFRFSLFAIQDYNTIANGVVRNFIICVRTVKYVRTHALNDVGINMLIRGYNYRYADPTDNPRSIAHKNRIGWTAPYTMELSEFYTGAINRRYADWNPHPGVIDPDERKFICRAVQCPMVSGRCSTFGVDGHIFTIEVGVSNRTVGSRTQVRTEDYHLNPNSTSPASPWPNIANPMRHYTDKYLQEHLSNYNSNTRFTRYIEDFGALRRAVSSRFRPFSRTYLADPSNMLSIVSFFSFLLLILFCIQCI